MMEMYFIALAAVFVIAVFVMMFNQAYKNPVFYVAVGIVLIMFAALVYTIERHQGYAKLGIDGLPSKWFILNYYDDVDNKKLSIMIRERGMKTLRLVELPSDMYDKAKKTLQNNKGTFQKGIPMEGSFDKPKDGTDGDGDSGSMKGIKSKQKSRKDFGFEYDIKYDLKVSPLVIEGTPYEK